MMTNSLTITEEIIETKVAEVWLNLGILHEAVSAFSRQECLDSFWPCVCQNSRWVIPAKRMAILLQTEPNRCQVVAWLERGKLIPPTGTLYDFGQDMIGQTINGKGVKWFNRPWGDATTQDELRHWLFKDDPDAILAVPIQTNAEIVGIILFVLRSLGVADQTMLSSLATGYAMYVGATYAMLQTTTKLAAANKKLEAEISERKRAEKTLREYQEHLQELVTERTAELAKTNEQLQQEIAGHERTEAGLRESEEKFRTLAETTAAGIIIHQGNRFVYVNSAAEVMTGYSRAELLAMNSLNMTHPDFRQLAQQQTAARVQGQNPPPKYVLKFFKKSGEVCWVYATIGLIEYAGQPAVLVTFFDITERKQIEESLRQIATENLRLARAVEVVSQGISISDPHQPDNPLIYVNPAFSDITGYSVEESLGRNCRFLQGPDTDPATSAKIRQALAEQREVEVTILNYRKDGRPFWNELKIFPIFSDEGQLFYFVGVQSDITQRKQAEEELRESEEKWRSLVENAPDFVFIIDRNHTIQFVNRVIPGLSVEQVIGTKARDYISPEYRDMVDERLERAFQIGEVDSYETTAPSSDGRTLWYSTRIGPIKHEDQVVALTLISTDITESKQVEEALTYARDQALEASQLKSKLLAKVSHELRTPLNAILGFAELLEFGLYGSLADGQREPLIEIIDSTNDLTNLVDELLDQAQLDAGQLKLNITQFAPLEIIGKVRNRMNVLAQAKGIGLTTEIAPDVPPMLSGDRERVQQILINLVSNAIKFTETGYVKVRLYCPNESHWAMQILDTGPGIPPEARARIFEPFQQVDNSITRKHGGSGLGLSIVKQLITLMGGEITLESESGQGSTFTVLLPTYIHQGEAQK